jgi:glycosyltransferase involved in cell wall biosynthesis
MLGAVTSLDGAALRASADIFTAHNQTGRSTNQTESYGVSVVEAMAASIPVVTGRSGGVTETVVDGETGVLVSPGDIEGHARALFELARRPEWRTWLGANGLRRARAEFSIERETARLRELLCRAINEAGEP